MLNEIIQLLKVTPYGVSKNIDFAKGTMQKPTKFNQIKRAAKWLSSK